MQNLSRHPPIRSQQKEYQCEFHCDVITLLMTSSGAGHTSKDSAVFFNEGQPSERDTITHKLLGHLLYLCHSDNSYIFDLMMEVHQSNVKSLEQTCFEALKDHLCPEKCIGLWQFTKVWYIPILFKLKYEAFHFICENFEEVSLCEEFLQLAVQELADILGQDDLTVTQESTVYQSVLRWINHMPEERQGAISTLLPKVRLGLMDKSYITDNVLNNDVVKTNPESHLFVSDTLKVMSQPSLFCSESGINNTLFCRRLPNAVLLMLRLYSKTIEAFDYRTNSWITVHTHPSLENPMIHLFYSTVFLGRCFYIVGSGLRWTNPFNRVWRFNLVTHTWQEMSPMQEPRYLMSVTELKGYIYGMGGYRNDDGTSRRTAERYQPNINQWTFIASMNEERRDASCTTLNNKIYICGGWNNRILNTAEYYNPDTNQWTLITPMGTPRCGLGVIAYMGHIFAVGGSDGSRYLRSAEAYDPVTNTWSRASCTTLNNNIYICGGQSNRVLNTAEYYNPDTNQWTLITPMGTPRYDLGVVAYMGHIFAVGGSYGFRDLRSAEAYDPVTNTWYDVPEMVHRHWNFDIAVMNKQIFVVSCRRRNRIVECYDYTTNTWSVVFSGMNHCNDCVRCCVISRLPNMAEYCSPHEPIIPRTQV
uniref:BACK domain-containing protein n=1 Tax=Gouania willdenowi TaxID=441366 RepID=A0A8C5GNK3_GOUWI